LHRVAIKRPICSLPLKTDPGWISFGQELSP
jgi:hypothetical protein